MSKTLTIRLDQKLAHALEKESRETGISKVEIVRQSLEARLRGSVKLSVMQRHFGTVHGPSDLSTSKKYRREWNRG